MPTPAHEHDGRQAGSVTTELVMLMPVVLLLVMLIVQFGLWLHARQVATSAAQEGLVAVQVELGTDIAGLERAAAFLAATGGLRDVQIEAVREAATARVSVTGNTPAVIPGMKLGISAHAEGPTERFVSGPDR
ncbi:MAG: pilus assembly protein [Actinobacteria bacterium]|jgi:Flp pilus assembly protein TadG|nr:pilus assembly protein [Actinomycetota bacterium]